MGLWILPFLFLFVLPTLAVQADIVSVPVSPHSGLMKEPDPVEIPYVFSKLTLKNSPVEEFKIDHTPKPVAEASFAIISTAEAAETVLTVDYVEHLANAVNDATALHELQPLLSEHNYQVLRDKYNKGISQYTILAVIQSMRPRDIRVLDSKVEEGRAVAAVKGWSHYGPTQGKIHLVKSDGLWKIESEEWQAARSHIPIHSFLSPSMRAGSGQKDLIAQVSPDVKYNYNILGLQRVPFQRKNKAISFVFFMNKPKDNLKGSKILPGEEVELTKERKRMHILWTASKRMPREQLFVEDKYPMDVSVARYNDGFAPGMLNMVMPRKKPKEIDLVMLWAF